jgi:hypothetical protein
VSKLDVKKELVGLDFFLWIQPGRSNEPDPRDTAFVNASPAAYQTIIRSFDGVGVNPNAGQMRKVRARRPMPELVAKIFDQIDGRAHKRERGFDVEAELRRRTGLEVRWLEWLIVRFDETARDDERYSLEESSLTVRFNRTRLDEFVQACREQVGPWGNEGMFGRGLPCGLWFAPDWFGVE